MTHTPGPWKAANLDTCPSISGATASITLLVDLFGNYRSDDNLVSDARLIAAAPDLLAALQDYFSDRCTIQDFQDHARAAIRKATGD